MSETNLDDVKTPVPQRAGAESAYFPMMPMDDTTYGITSITTSVGSSVDAEKSNMASLDAIMAQQELIGRALSIDRPWSAPASESDRRHTEEKLRSYSEQSTRPGTPVSSMPIPSNPSSFPDDQQPVTGPSLVMPEITIQQRKPYTDAGRRVGKLRVMFCGDSLTGKTTLLRTFAARCRDIVHHESLVGSEPGRPTTEINEVQASTQPYQEWRILPNMRHAEPIMERNICLIDTPGYGLSAEADDAIDPILQYLETQYRKTNQTLHDNTHLTEDDFLSLIAAPQGFTHVDAIIYCISKELSAIDMKFIDRLSDFAGVIPVITQADKLTTEERLALQADIRSKLQSEAYSVSCRDPEIECSIMMCDDYSPTLEPSDLEHLFASLLHDDHPARLRHATAHKFLLWKTKHQSLIHLPDSESTLLPSADFTVSRIAEHTRLEDTKSRLRIAAWASEMRTSFALARTHEKSGDWLLTRMNDYIETEKRNALIRTSKAAYVDESDPLGLLRLRERWSRRLKRLSKWCIDLTLLASLSFVCFQFWRS